MPSEHLVVDGSNIATEGRSEPSLDQLESAVDELQKEFADYETTVVVDATFSHRIQEAERKRFDEAVLRGDYIQPPAGAIGRGDAFLLRIAEKVNAVVCSNDSFQEFHGEHPWLFERGRLIGATPVPGIGWIFSPRTPVRGPKSRRSVQSTDQAKKKISKAIEVATKEITTTKKAPAGRTAAPAARTAPAPSVATVNDPLTFISFIAEHALGTEVEGIVDSFTSHGAVVFVGSVQCYLPLAAMADPAPRSAKEVLKRNEQRSFVVTALDPQRRGVEIALPEVAAVSGRPSAEMVAAEVRIAKRAAKKAATAKKAAAPAKKTAGAPTAKKAAAPAATKAAAPTGKSAASAPTAKKTAAPTAKKSAGAAKKAAGAPTAKKTAPAKKAATAAKKTAAVPTAKKSAAPAKKAAAPTAKKVASGERTAPAKRTPRATK